MKFCLVIKHEKTNILTVATSKKYVLFFDFWSVQKPGFARRPYEVHWLHNFKSFSNWKVKVFRGSLMAIKSTIGITANNHEHYIPVNILLEILKIAPYKCCLYWILFHISLFSFPKCRNFSIFWPLFLVLLERMFWNKII